MPRKASIYTQYEWLVDLEDLNNGRLHHACGWFTNSIGERINIVAGGFNGDTAVNTVELNVDGQFGWQFGTQLPSQLDGLRGITIDAKFYITGGRGDEDGIQIYDSDKNQCMYELDSMHNYLHWASMVWLLSLFI